MGLGSDTGGPLSSRRSIGLVGLKSTVGRISRFGVFLKLDLTPLDRQSDVEDAALVYQILQGEDSRDESTYGIRPEDVLSPLKTDLKGLRIGIPQHVFFDNTDTEIEKAVLAAAAIFRDLGATVENVPYPEAEAVNNMASIINGVEAAVIHEERLLTKSDLMDPVVGPRMLAERDYLATDYVKMLNDLKELRVSQEKTLATLT